MDGENNNFKFQNLIESDSFNQSSINHQQKRDFVKAKLMNKYNISSQNAEIILNHIEKKIIKSKNVTDDNKDVTLSKDSQGLSNKQNNNSWNSQQIPKTKHIQQSTKLDDDIKYLDSNKSNDSNTTGESYGGDVKEHFSNTQSKSVDSQQNVDEIISNIIPNYNQQVSIEVNHVDLTFEVANDKIDTVKETVIRTLKRNKSKKLKIHALNDISFKIYKGEKVGIIGYNGAGKSSLLNVITGIYPPDKGFVKTFGNISPLLSLGAGFDYNYSGRKNIMLNGAVLGYDKSFLESKMDEIIEFSELGDFIDIPIKNYSSGMLAKLGFSIATAVNPDILIIDEILGVGDVTFNRKSTDKIKSLMDGGTTVLFVSHSIPQVREICDKAIWIDNGHLREIGEVNKVCDHYLKDSENARNEQLANIQFK